MTENQKLREALQAISDIDDSTNHAVDASAALDRIGQIARQALALPTAEQVGDINVVESFTSVTKTAPPVGERERFEKWASREGYLTTFEPNAMCSKGLPVYKDPRTHAAWWVWQSGRAALSAGAAVDAQRLDFIEKSARCDPKMDGQHVWWPTSLNKALKGPTLRDAIDAAMRKGQI